MPRTRKANRIAVIQAAILWREFLPPAADMDPLFSYFSRKSVGGSRPIGQVSRTNAARMVYACMQAARLATASNCCESVPAELVHGMAGLGDEFIGCQAWCLMAPILDRRREAGLEITEMNSHPDPVNLGYSGMLNAVINRPINRYRTSRQGAIGYFSAYAGLMDLGRRDTFEAEMKRLDDKIIAARQGDDAYLDKVVQCSPNDAARKLMALSRVHWMYLDPEGGRHA